MNVVNCSTRLPPKPAANGAQAYPVIVKPAVGYHVAVEKGVTWNGAKWEGTSDTVVAWVDPVAEVKQVPPPLTGSYRGPIAEDESTLTFTVTLTDPGANRLAAIKLVREVLGLGLGESKAFVEKTPAVIKSERSRADANALQAKFAGIGATVTVTKE